MYGFCFFLANATVHKVAATTAAAMRASAGLLNSGTFAVEVGLEPLEELDGSDITAMLPMLPDKEPGIIDCVDRTCSRVIS